MQYKLIKNIEIQYFGNICYFFNLIKSTYIYFDDGLSHQKGKNWNRTWIMGANNLLCLTVPLDGGRSVKSSVKDLRIANREPWQRIHWRGIHDSYRKSPWFEEYASGLKNIIHQNYNFLWDLNIRSFEWTHNILGLKSAILADRPDFDIKRENADLIISDQNVPRDYPSYTQVFSDKLGFIPNLSILDLILNEGPMAGSYLKKLADFQ